ncbi:MAG: hypothetical protein WDZ45_00015, partial [Flavobacteriaceae bacterium]
MRKCVGTFDPYLNKREADENLFSCCSSAVQASLLTGTVHLLDIFHPSKYLKRSCESAQALSHLTGAVHLLDIFHSSKYLKRSCESAQALSHLT